MKTNDVYLNRLLKFGRYMGKTHLRDVLFKREIKTGCSKYDTSVECFAWALEALPHVFKEWTFSPESIACLKNNERLNSLTAAAVWFNLNFDTLSHLFLPGYQDSIYGGNVLDEAATPGDLSNNIYEYVKIMIEEQLKDSLKPLPATEPIKTKIYKLKNQKYETRNTDFLPRMWA
ncbi:MAG: hypothetical protein JWP12_2456 [Bacteroidetes bacterium]|nr:hypothetical protein [Bacteroidota bacterium]